MHLLFPKLRRVPFKKYLTAKYVAEMLEISLGHLYYKLISNKKLVAFKFSNGEIFIHPDAAFKEISKHGKAILKSADNHFSKYEKRRFEYQAKTR